MVAAPDEVVDGAAGAALDGGELAAVIAEGGGSPLAVGDGEESAAVVKGGCVAADLLQLITAAGGGKGVAVGKIRFEGAAVILVKGEGAAVRGDVGVAVDDAVAAIGAFPHHRHAAHRHPQVRFPVVVRAGRVENVVGVGNQREKKKGKTENGGMETNHCSFQVFVYLHQLVA